MDATLCGILNLDKPAGLSSARAVTRGIYLLPRGVKIGHAGTLDPFATGVLLVLVGRPATRLSGHLMGQAKRYVATIKLGATTDTLDPTSPEIVAPDVRPVDRDAIEAILPSFLGDVLQQPPQYSALKVGGRPAYALARAGETVPLAPRTIRVYALTITAYAWPFLSIDLHCGRGTYVRSIARDIGERLGVGGYVHALRRTAVGEFDVSTAVSPDLLRDADDVLARLRPTINHEHVLRANPQPL